MKRVVEWITAREFHNPDDRQYNMQERVLVIFQTCTIISVVGQIILNSMDAFQSSSWFWTIAYCLLFLISILIILIRQLSFNVRTNSTIIVILTIGIITELQFGFVGIGSTIFLSASILAVILLGLGWGIFTVFLNTLLYLSFSWIIQNGILGFSNINQIPFSEDFHGWIRATTPILPFLLIVPTASGLIIHGFKNILSRQKQDIELLRSDQELLRNRSLQLRHREQQVRTAAEISQSIISVLDPDQIFQQVADLLQNRFELYYVGIFTLDSTSNSAVLRAGTGLAGKNMLMRKHSLPIDASSMIGYAINQKEPQAASDIDIETHHFRNPELPLTHSELAIPMISAGEVLGAITVQSAEINAFDEDDTLAYQSIADSMATALVNANLFNQVQINLAEVQNLQRQYTRETWEKATAEELNLDFSFNQVHPQPGSVGETTLPTTELKVPLTLRNQEIGNLFIEADRTSLTPQEYAFIDSVLQQTVQALENIRLVEEIQRSSQQDRIANQISSELSRAMNVDSVVKTAVREFSRLPNVTEVSIILDPLSDKA